MKHLIHHSASALLLVDLINDFNFDGGSKLLKHTKSILPNIIQLKNYAKAHHIPIIYINDHYKLWTSDPNKIINYCMNNYTKDIISGLKPKSDEYFLIKPQHSAFFQTPLKSLLDELKRNHLIIAGIAGDICVLFTAKDAYMHQFSMHIPSNCIASEEKEGNDYALYLLSNVMKANTKAFELS